MMKISFCAARRISLGLSLVLVAPLCAQEAPSRATTLYDAIRKGDLAGVKTALAAEPKLANGTWRGESALYSAIQTSKPEIVTYLLEQGADPNSEYSGNSPLSRALSGYGDNWKVIADALIAKGAKIDGTDSAGNAPLLQIVSQGNSSQKERIAYLLGKGANLNARDRRGRSALDIAITGGSSEVVTLLLDKADLKSSDEGGNTPLFSAVARGSAEITRLILDKGADINAQNAGGDTALHLAAQNPGALLKMLIDSGARTNLKNKRGDLPLHVALRRRDEFSAASAYSGSPFGRRSYNLETIESRGASDEDAAPRGTLIAPLTDKSDVNARDQFGLSPLLIALMARDQESRDLILERAPKLDATTKLFDACAQGNVADLKTLLTQKPFLVYFRLADGTTPLHTAALWGSLSAAQLLVSKGADVNARDSRGETPLHKTLSRPSGLFARRARNMSAFLLEKGADVNALDVLDNSPLHRATKSGEAELVTALLAKNADVNARDRAGQTPIFALMTKGADLKLVAALIDKGAQLNFRSQNDNGLLARAVQTRRKELVQLLLDKGADASQKNSEGRGVLGELVSNGDRDGATEIAALLLAKGADPNEKMYSETLLSRAISRDSKEFVRLLLATKKVDLKASGERQSPLFQALNSGGRVEIVQLLLEAGADPNEKDEKGRTAAQVGTEKSKEMAAVFAAKVVPAT